MTTTHDLAALLAAIDAGDDSALAALADLLEEQGGPSGLRTVIAFRPLRGGYSAETWYWSTSHMIPCHLLSPERRAAQVDCDTITRLGSHPGCLGRIDNDCGGDAIFASRSAAYLALAESLSETQEAANG